jgi:uncharacterized membrane protein
MQADKPIQLPTQPIISTAAGVTLDKRNHTPLIVAGLTVGGFGALLLALPGNFASKLLLLSTGTCAQRPAHSYFMGDLQLPMEGRMVGIFGSYALTLFFLWFIGRGRALHLPKRGMMLVLGALIVPMALDGLNATAFDAGLPTLYTPQNWLRLASGVLSGIGMAGLIQPFFNMTVWKRGYNRRSFQSWGELAALLVLGLLLWLATLSGWAWLYWPVALLTIGGLVAALVMLNFITFALILRRERRVESPLEFLTPLSFVFIFSLGELVLFAVLRVAVLGPPV